ncbi:MAG TPA: glycosyltransferase family 39 protein, partial [Thermomicrobiales bacterium]|nr:glycosyltransferase family 39 protein [Thermomicrobiales bacterium]
MTERREPAMPDQDSQPSRTAQNAWLQNARRRELLALGVIALLALAIRVAWLGSIPGNITADEADNLKTIFSIQTRSEPGFFGLDWKPQPAMSMYLVSGFMQIFGQDIFGMRMASAVLSTLALLPFYALARRVVGPLAALGGAALLA